jgi:cell division septation protein DedD
LADAHRDTDDGFHEIQLSGKQLVFLFMATTVVSVVIFLCGVLVGRGVRTDRVVDAAEPIASAATPASTLSPAPAPPSTAAGPPAAEPPPPANDEALSYHKRLESETPPSEKLKTEKGPAKPEPAAPARASAPTSGAHPGAWVVQVVALKDRAAAAAVVERLSGKGYPAFLVNPAADAPVIYRVQVGRYDDRGQAEETARRLKKEEQFNPWISR